MTAELRFDWDDNNIQHLARGVRHAEFEQVMRHDPILFDYENVDGEDRWTGLGSTDDLRFRMVAFTIREGRIRAVTIFLASTKRVRELWKQNIDSMPSPTNKKRQLVIPGGTFRRAVRDSCAQKNPTPIA